MLQRLLRRVLHRPVVAFDSLSGLPPLKPEDRLPGYEAFREWVEAEGLATHPYFGYGWSGTAWIVSRPHESVQGRRGGRESAS